MTIGNVIVRSLKEGTNGIKFEGILASYPNRYVMNISSKDHALRYREWLINELTEGGGLILAVMEDYATVVLRGGDLILLYHYLMDEVYCNVIKELIDKIVKEHS